MSDLPTRPATKPTPPACLLCHTPAHVSVHDTPEYPHIHYYRCSACGQFWATKLNGQPVLFGPTKES